MEFVIAAAVVGAVAGALVIGMDLASERGGAAACRNSADALRAAAVTQYAVDLSHLETFSQLTSDGHLDVPPGATVSDRAITTADWVLRLDPGSPGAPPTFTCVDPDPPVAGATLWLDASDTHSLTVADDAVTSWTDRRARRVATASATAGPRLTTVDGTTLLRFDGVDDALDVDLASEKGTVIAVVRSTAAVWRGTGALLERSDMTSGARLGTIFQDGERFFHHNPAPAAVRHNGSPLARPFDTVDPSQLMVLSVWPSNTRGSTQLSIGATDGRYFSSIDVGELIVYPRSLSSEEVDAVEQYLMDKWAITP